MHTPTVKKNTMSPYHNCQNETVQVRKLLHISLCWQLRENFRFCAPAFKWNLSQSQRETVILYAFLILLSQCQNASANSCIYWWLWKTPAEV